MSSSLMKHLCFLATAPKMGREAWGGRIRGLPGAGVTAALGQWDPAMADFAAGEGYGAAAGGVVVAQHRHVAGV